MRILQSLLFSLLTVLALEVPLFAADSPQTVFSADQLGAPHVLRLIAPDVQTVQSDEAGPVIRYELGLDPYNEKSLDFRWTDEQSPQSSSIVVEIEYLDRGAGVIQPRLLVDDRYHGEWSSPVRQCCYTRLNTNTVRRAYFQFTVNDLDWAGTEHAHLRITGLQYLKSIRVHEALSEQAWEDAVASIPRSVTPMVTLKRPMDIVCSSGTQNKGGRETLQPLLEYMRELVPLAKVLGFNSVESYVIWNRVELEKGEFDWAYFDAIVEQIRAYDMKWFPLLIVGSAYALPDWFLESGDSVEFVCLEHGLPNLIQSIWSPTHREHVTRFLRAFGEHYEPMGVLQGVRLGPSGNFGESQYPAGGNWGYKGEEMHIHIGYWAGDDYARKDFQRFATERYGTVDDVNAAWGRDYASITDVKPVLPGHCHILRERIDFTEWYTKSMSDWCEWWGVESRMAMPNTRIYQSAGGWGFREAGTDYVDQAKSMTLVDGGIRLTNETDSYQQNFYATRLAATAARLYDIPLGYEPASSHTARGTAGRIFNTAVTNGDHFFTYDPNVLFRPTSVQKWLEHYEVFDVRQEPVIDVAIYYPETMNQIDESAFRYLYGWGFNPRAREVREQIEVDYLNETLIREGFLDRYKALVFIWGNIIEKDVQDVIDHWIRSGGTTFYPSFPRGSLRTVEGDTSTFKNWSRGNCGDGAFLRFQGDAEPPALYGEFVADGLQSMDGLHPWTKMVLEIEHPPRVYFSIQKDGHLMALNYDSKPARIRLPGVFEKSVPPYAVLRVPLAGK